MHIGKATIAVVGTIIALVLGGAGALSGCASTADLDADAAERWVGSDAYLDAERRMMQAFDVNKLVRREETVRISQAGGVAWFSTVFDIEIETGGEVARYEGLRTTGVIERRSGRWLIVQSHTSVPVAGQQVQYRSDQSIR